MKRGPLKRWLEDRFLDFAFWFFGLTELPHIDEACDSPDCARCLQKRRKRRAA